MVRNLITVIKSITGGEREMAPTRSAATPCGPSWAAGNLGRADLGKMIVLFVQFCICRIASLLLITIVLFSLPNFSESKLDNSRTITTSGGSVSLNMDYRTNSEASATVRLPGKPFMLEYGALLLFHSLQ